VAFVQPPLALGYEDVLQPLPYNVGRAGRLEDGVVWRAIAMVDASPIVPQVLLWKAKDRKGPGGRPEKFPVRALIVAMLICAMTGRPTLATVFTDVLFRQISPTMRHERCAASGRGRCVWMPR
jgi:hypothetical protein